MRRMLSQLLSIVCVLTLGSAGWPQVAAATPASVAKLAASTSKESQACIKCHQDTGGPAGRAAVGGEQARHLRHWLL